MQQKELQGLLRRAHRYWFEDGLPEMAIGLLFGLLGLYFALRGATALHDGLNRAVSIGGILLIVAYALLLNRLVMLAKERITFPRTGYVSYRPSSALRRVVSTATSVGVALATVWGAAYLARSHGESVDVWQPLVAGFFIGLAFLYLGRRLSLIRFYGHGLFSGMWGALVVVSSIDAASGGVAYFGGVGTVLVFSGVLQLGAYLRSTESRPEGNAR